MLGQLLLVPNQKGHPIGHEHDLMGRPFYIVHLRWTSLKCFAFYQQQQHKMP
jgi:hypothetical protein